MLRVKSETAMYDVFNFSDLFTLLYLEQFLHLLNKFYLCIRLKYISRLWLSLKSQLTSSPLIQIVQATISYVIFNYYITHIIYLHELSKLLIVFIGWICISLISVNFMQISKKFNFHTIDIILMEQCDLCKVQKRKAPICLQ